MDPEFGGAIIHGQQQVEVVGDLGGRLGPLGCSSRRRRRLAVSLVLGLGVPDLGERILRARPTTTPKDTMPHWPRIGSRHSEESWATRSRKSAQEQRHSLNKIAIQRTV